MRQWRWITVAAVVLAIAACGGSGSDSGSGSGLTNPGGPGTPTPPGGGGSSTNTITLESQSFSPSEITVPKGTTVVFSWAACDSSYGGYGSGGCVSHNVVFDDGSNISSGTMSSGAFTRTFNTTGQFKFHCSIHGAALMSGSVTVQ